MSILIELWMSFPSSTFIYWSWGFERSLLMKMATLSQLYNCETIPIRARLKWVKMNSKPISSLSFASLDVKLSRNNSILGPPKLYSQNLDWRSLSREKAKMAENWPRSTFLLKETFNQDSVSTIDEDNDHHQAHKLSLDNYKIRGRR